MSKKKDTPTNATASKRGPGRPVTGRKPTHIVYARIKPSLGEALKDFLDSEPLNPSQTTVVELALEAFLRDKGFWPPSASPSDD